MTRGGRKRFGLLAKAGAGSLAEAGVICALAMSAADAAPQLFTAAQVHAGQIQYGEACAGCHGADLRGITGPALIGQAFAKPADRYTLALIFNTIWQGTPAGAPDSLSKTEYVNITAYILSRNGFNAGTEMLTYKIASTSTAPIASLVP